MAFDEGWVVVICIAALRKTGVAHRAVGLKVNKIPLVCSITVTESSGPEI